MHLDILGLEPTAAGGAAAIRAALEKVQWLCGPCCPDVPSVEKCKADAAKIVEELAKLWESEFGKGPRGHDHARGGYYCSDWASGFRATVRNLHSDIWSAVYRRFDSIDSSDTVHYAVKIYIKNAKTKGCFWNIDDGYLEDGMIHDGNWPTDPGWRESPFPDYPPRMTPVLPRR